MDKLKSNLDGLLLLLTPDQLHGIWIAAGAVLFISWVWWSYGFIRRCAGHIKFRGTWYNAEQHQALLKMIDEDNAKGFRVMKHDEMALLRKWKMGDTKTYSTKKSGYA